MGKQETILDEEFGRITAKEYFGIMEQEKITSVREFKIGTPVRLKHRRSAGISKIKLFYSDIEGGVKLEDKLDGFYSWNVTDLEVVSFGTRLA